MNMEDNSGMKWDEEKPMWDLVPLETIEKIADVLTYGAKKYAPNNWQKISSDRYFAALMRHMTAWQSGEKIDEESKKQHLAHAMCNVMFLLWKEDNGTKSTENTRRS